MTNLSESENTTVRAYLDRHEIVDGFQSKAEMLTSLCEELVNELESYKEQVALGITNKVKYGTFVLHMPVQYMTENAKPKDVTVYNLLKEQLTKINNGETAAMILPALTDESGNRMFTLEYVGPQKI